MAWPTKTDFVDGDVLTAAQVNNIGTNLNVFNPTAATNGQVLTANGSGSASFQTPTAAAFTQIATGSISGTTYDITSIPGTYKHLFVRIIDYKPTSGSGRLYVYPQNSASTYTTFVNSYYGNTAGYSYTLYMDSQFSVNTTGKLDATIWIYDYASTTNTMKQYQYVMSTPSASNAVGAPPATCMGSGYSTVSGAITYLRVQNSGGGSQSGTWILYGVN
jgi:hypothetical protein